jgi:DNA-binding response OmpR family regulator
MTQWDYDLRRVMGPAGMVVLQPLPADALFALIEQAGQLVTRERLAARLYGSVENIPIDRALDVVIHRLRAKLRACKAEWQVTTVFRSGWVLEGLPKGKFDPKTGQPTFHNVRSATT